MHAAENPFIFGKVVRGEHFCDRKEEISQIKKIVDSNQHMIIISPRRYGKTSLVVNALERNKTPHVYIDCSFLENEKDLLENILNDYAKKTDNTAVLEKFLRRFDMSFSITVNPVSVTIKDAKTNSLKSVLSEIGKNYALVFDEFQDMYEKNRKTVNKMRSAVQFLEKSTIMLGSKRHTLENMFLRPRGIFYNFGYALHLEKIGKEEFKEFITKWFTRSSIGISEEEIEELLVITENHPFFTQYFCHFLLEKRLSGKASVRETLQGILDTNAAFYDSTFRQLSSNQRKALLLLSRGKKEVYSKSLVDEFEITSSQALQKALNSLVKKELVDKNGSYCILDVFFRHWLYQMVLNQKV